MNELVFLNGCMRTFVNEQCRGFVNECVGAL